MHDESDLDEMTSLELERLIGDLGWTYFTLYYSPEFRSYYASTKDRLIEGFGVGFRGVAIACLRKALT